MPRRSLLFLPLVLLPLLLPCAPAQPLPTNVQARFQKAFAHLDLRRNADGQYYAVAAEDMAKGTAVFREELAGFVTAVDALRRVFPAGSEHQVASILVETLKPLRGALPSTGFTSARDEPPSDETAYVPPQELQAEEAVQDFAMAVVLTSAASDAWWREPLKQAVKNLPSGATDEEAAHLLGIYATERTRALATVATWKVAIKALQTEGLLRYTSGPVTLLEAYQIIRSRSLIGPDEVGGMLIGAPSAVLDQACNADATLGISVVQEKGRALVVGYTQGAVKKGSRLGLKYYTHDPAYQEAVVVYGCTSPALDVGIHYYIPQDEVENDPTSVLRRENCPTGELKATENGTLSKLHTRCIQIHQLPHTVRGNYRQLTKGKHERGKLMEAIGGFLEQILVGQYNVSKASLKHFDLSVPPTLGEVTEEEEDVPEEMKQILEEIGSSSTVDDSDAQHGSQDAAKEVIPPRVKQWNSYMEEPAQLLRSLREHCYLEAERLLAGRRMAEMEKLRAQSERIKRIAEMQLEEHALHKMADEEL